LICHEFPSFGCLVLLLGSFCVGSCYVPRRKFSRLTQTWSQDAVRAIREESALGHARRRRTVHNVVYLGEGPREADGVGWISRRNRTRRARAGRSTSSVSVEPLVEGAAVFPVVRLARNFSTRLASLDTDMRKQNQPRSPEPSAPSEYIRRDTPPRPECRRAVR